MFDLNSVRRAPGVRSALAVACGMTVSAAVMAQEQGQGEVLAPVVVSASRMPQLLQTAPIGATVITAEQIQRSGVADANEAIRKLGGVPGRSDLSNGREYGLDLRGFGATSQQNTLVLIDGIRVSENEIASARLSAVPLDLIDRIEIVRGGASVSWGEGASAGVINVILKHPQGATSFAKLGAAVESRGGQEATASGQIGVDKTTLDASFKRVRSDGARDNSAYKQDVLGLGAAWRDEAFHANLRLIQEHQNARLPGSLPLSQYRADPSVTISPSDHADTDESRLLGNVGWQRGAWSVQTDLGQRTRNTKYLYVYGAVGYPNFTHSVQSQITPRVNHEANWGGVNLKSALGLDWQGWDFKANDIETAMQENQAGFVQFDLGLPSQTRVTTGWRQEHVRRRYDGSVDYANRDKLHAGELGVNQTIVPGVDLYGRAATSYRVANVDENRYKATAEPLRPQRNEDREIGVKLASGEHALTIRRFEQKTNDEIAYNAKLFVNQNIDPTQRRGVEIEGHLALTSQLSLQATWQQISAKFREGANAGKEMPEVAPHSGTVRLAWRLDDRQTLDAGLQYISNSRYSGDDANGCSMRVPSSTLLDGRYAWTARDWSVAVSGTNLTDRKGYNVGFTNAACVEPNVYPYVGRSLKLAVSRQF